MARTQSVKSVKSVAPAAVVNGAHAAVAETLAPIVVAPADVAAAPVVDTAALLATMQADFAAQLAAVQAKADEQAALDKQIVERTRAKLTQAVAERNAAQAAVPAPVAAPVAPPALHAAAADIAALQAQFAALQAERDELVRVRDVAAHNPKPVLQPVAAAVASTLPPVSPTSAATSAAFAATQDTLLSMGIVLPTWKQIGFSTVLFIAAVAGGWVAAPILASILVAGTATVTASGFAAWMAAALGYLIAAWASVKAAKGVSAAVSWIGTYAATLAPKPVTAA